MKNYICLVCGFDKLEESPYIGGINSDAGSYEICPCCCFQYGYEQKSMIPQYREEWLAKGAKWFQKSVMPDNWNLREQLQRINYILKED